MASICLPRIEQIQQMSGFEAEPCHLSFCGKDGKPIPESMAKRNARERTRVHQLNATFDVLKKRLPVGFRKGRLSKCGILRKSTEYIQFLLDELTKPSGDRTEQGMYTYQGGVQRQIDQQMSFHRSNETGAFSETCGMYTDWTDEDTQYLMPSNADFVTNTPGRCSQLNQEVDRDTDFKQSNFSSCMYPNVSHQMEKVEAHSINNTSFNLMDTNLLDI